MLGIADTLAGTAAAVTAGVLAAAACAVAARLGQARRALAAREAELERLRAEAGELQARLLARHERGSLGALAGIVHEIADPIAVVASGVEVLACALDAPCAADAELRATRDEVIPDVRDALHRVRAIAGDLRAFARGGPAGAAET